VEKKRSHSDLVLALRLDLDREKSFDHSSVAAAGSCILVVAVGCAGKEDLAAFVACLALMKACFAEEAAYAASVLVWTAETFDAEAKASLDHLGSPAVDD
jgi:hypothetical protein